jgi:hypothetical protein
MYNVVESSEETALMMNLSYYSNIILEKLGKSRKNNSDS